MAVPLPAVAGGAVVGYEAGSGGLLNTSTPAGWATIWTAAAFVILTVLMARGEGLVRGLVRAVEFSALVMLAHIVSNYLLHSSILNYEGDTPWDGLRLTQ